MSMKLKVSFGLYLINALVLFGFAFRYFFADRLMPYHAETLGVARDGLSGGYPLVFTTLYRAVGTGMLVTGVTVLVLLLIPFRGHQAWSRWALSGIILLYACLSLFLTLAYQAGTTADVPWPGPAVAVVTIVIAHFLAGEMKGAPATDA